jgi:hypothetical protein
MHLYGMLQLNRKIGLLYGLFHWKFVVLLVNPQQR